MAWFGFLSSCRKSAKGTSRNGMPAVTISQNKATNHIYPCVVMSASTHTSEGCYIQHLEGCTCSSQVASGGSHAVSWYGSGSMLNNNSGGRASSSESRSYVTADSEDTHVQPSAQFHRSHHSSNNATGNNHHRHSSSRHHRSHSSRRSNSNRHHHSHERAPITEPSRLPDYTAAMENSNTCFVGSNPVHPDDPVFRDQTVRFRVIDRTVANQEAGGERVMVVVASPRTLPTVMDTLAPTGSGRSIVVQAVDAYGALVEGDVEFLAYTVLPQGWKFDLVIAVDEDEED